MMCKLMCVDVARATHGGKFSHVLVHWKLVSRQLKLTMSESLACVMVVAPCLLQNPPS